MSRIFILPFTFKATFFLELIFVYGVRKSSLYFFPYGYPINSVPFIKNIIVFFSLLCNATFVTNQVSLHVWISEIAILFHWSVCLSLHKIHSLNLSCFRIRLIFDKKIAPLLLVKSALAVLGLCVSIHILELAY